MQRFTRRCLLRLKRTQGQSQKTAEVASTTRSFNASKRMITMMEKQQLGDLLVKSIATSIVNKLNDVDAPVVDRSQLLMCGMGEDEDGT